MAAPKTFAGELLRLDYMREHRLSEDTSGVDWDGMARGSEEYRREMLQIAIENFAMDASTNELERLIEVAGFALVVSANHEPRLYSLNETKGTA
jgi:hypothetical protein